MAAEKSVLAPRDPAASPGLTLFRATGIHSSDIRDASEGAPALLLLHSLWDDRKVVGMTKPSYESWFTPATVILAVPFAFLGTVATLLSLGIANNICVQIGLVLLIALSAKNAMLIAEMAQEGRAAGKTISNIGGGIHETNPAIGIARRDRFRSPRIRSIDLK